MSDKIHILERQIAELQRRLERTLRQNDQEYAQELRERIIDLEANLATHKRARDNDRRA